MTPDNRAGIAFALCGFTMLSIGDGVVKSMAADWTPVGIAALRFAIAALVLGVVLVRREGAAGFALLRCPVQIGRGAALVMSSIAFFTSLSAMSLATATALTFTSPIITALLAGPLLGEPARREIWLASLVAFAGVLVILRPNLAEVGWLAILPLVAATGFSLLIILNRHVADRASPFAMQASLALVAAPLLIVATPIFALTGEPRFALSWPDWTIVARCAVVALFATIAHWLVFRGTMRAGAATVAPMTYIQILVATVLGWAFFNDQPDMLTLLGASIIVGAGLYVWRAGKVRELASD